MVDEQTGQCVPICPEGYLDENNNCLPCQENCYTCDFIRSEAVCRECNKGYFLTPDNECVPDCKAAGYVQANHLTCAKQCNLLEGVDYSDNNKCKVC